MWQVICDVIMQVPHSERRLHTQCRCLLGPKKKKKKKRDVTSRSDISCWFHHRINDYQHSPSLTTGVHDLSIDCLVFFSQDYSILSGDVRHCWHIIVHFLMESPVRRICEKGLIKHILKIAANIGLDYFSTQNDYSYLL